MKNILIFLAGGAVGAAITAKLVVKYYEEIIELNNEAVDETVKYYKDKIDELKNNEKGYEKDKVEDDKPEKKKEKKDDKAKINDIIETEQYSGSEEVIPKPVESITGIEIIEADVYGEEEGFDIASWMYWADGIVTNDFDEIVEDPESIIGDALSYFGNIEIDSVYVRNRANSTDYEILRSEKEFNA